MKGKLKGKKTYILAAGAVITAVGTAVSQEGNFDWSVFFANLWDQKDLLLFGAFGSTLRAAIAKIGG